MGRWVQLPSYDSSIQQAKHESAMFETLLRKNLKQAHKKIMSHQRNANQKHNDTTRMSIIIRRNKCW